MPVASVTGKPAQNRHTSPGQAVRRPVQDPPAVLIKLSWSNPEHRRPISVQPLSLSTFFDSGDLFYSPLFLINKRSDTRSEIVCQAKTRAFCSAGLRSLFAGETGRAKLHRQPHFRPLSMFFQPISDPHGPPCLRDERIIRIGAADWIPECFGRAAADAPLARES